MATSVDFNGTWQLYMQENAEEFLEAISAPEIFIKMLKEVKPITSIAQRGEEFEITVKTPLRSTTNCFTIGKENQFNTMDGKKVKATAHLVDGKIVMETEKFTHVREIQGEDMVETLTAGSVILTRRSKKM